MKWTIWLLMFLVQTVSFGQGSRFAVRFYGAGTGQADRIKIPLAAAPAINVGGDFTVEFWMRAHYADNAGVVYTGLDGDGWITGNVILDRDVYGGGDYGDYGVALGRAGVKSVLAFGVHNGTWGQTIVGTNHVGDGQWRHVAIQRELNNGAMRIYVDGRLDASGVGPFGNISYRVGRATSWPGSDPFLVLGAEKHDAGPEYPSFNGYLDELRIWTRILTPQELTNLAVRVLSPAEQFGVAGYFRLEEGAGSVVTDSVQGYTGVLHSALAGNGEWVSWTNGFHAAPITFHSPRIAVGDQLDSSVDLSWYASRNIHYDLIFTPALGDTSEWFTVDAATNLITGDSTLMVLVETAGFTSRFFRVRGRPYR